MKTKDYVKSTHVAIKFPVNFPHPGRKLKNFFFLNKMNVPTGNMSSKIDTWASPVKFLACHSLTSRQILLVTDIMYTQSSSSALECLTPKFKGAHRINRRFRKTSDKE